MSQRTAAEFDTALTSFVKGAQAIITDYRNEHFPTLPAVDLRISMGRRYAKLIRQENGADGSVHCFVDRTTGDVLMAAGWSAPAKRARGNIYQPDNGLGGMDQYGARSLR